MSFQFDCKSTMYGDPSDRATDGDGRMKIAHQVWECRKFFFVREREGSQGGNTVLTNSTWALASRLSPVSFRHYFPDITRKIQPE